VGCSELQRVAVSCSVSLTVFDLEMRCTVLQSVAACCSVLQRCSVLHRCTLFQYLADCPSLFGISRSDYQHILCCSALQHVAACCSVLQFVAVSCRLSLTVWNLVTPLPTHNLGQSCPTLPPAQPLCCSVLQCVAVTCSALYCIAVCCSVFQTRSCTTPAVCCSVLQCVAVCCIVSQ